MLHLIWNCSALHFFYNAQNKPAVALYDGVAYAYMYNLQGDVIALVDANGTPVVEYRYDAWGKPLFKLGTLATTLGTLNPFRYRGYVYDEETGLYYLQNRYYSPICGRFINADTIFKGNLYAYCGNNPIVLSDDNGKSAQFAYACMNDGGGNGYISPSARAPEAVLSRGQKGKNSGKIPVAYLLAYLDQMVESGDWKYVSGKMAWKAVDCIGMIRLAYQQYSQQLAKKSATYVGKMYHDAIKQGLEIVPLEGNESDLVPGMAVYWNDSTREKPWYHIGVYMGSYLDVNTGIFYSDAVIEAATGSYNRVIVRSLSDISDGLDKNTSLYFGYLQDVSY